MATNLACQSDDGNIAVFIGTNLSTGDAVTLCPDCLVQFCATIVENMTGVPVTEMLSIGADIPLEESPGTGEHASEAPGTDEVWDGITAAAADDITEHSTATTD